MKHHVLWRRVLSVVSVVSVFTSTVPQASAAPRRTPVPPVPAIATAQGGTTVPTPDPVPLLPVNQGPLLPGLTFDISTAPQVQVGETVPFSVTLINRSPNPGEDVVVSLPLPDGATAQPSAEVNPADDGWTWHVGHVAGQSETVLRGSLQLSRMPQGAALLLTPQATAAGLDTPVTRDGGALVALPLDTTASARFTPGSASQMRSVSGKVQVTFAAKGYGQPLTLRYTGAASKPTASTSAARTRPSAPAQVAGRRGFGTFSLTASDAQGQDIHQFAAPVTLRLQYTPEQLRVLGIAERDLTVFWFNTTTQTWEALPTTVDAASHTALTTVDHFTDFNLSDGRSPSTAFIPSLKSFQVSQFTGAASYAYPIELPAGAGGLKPSISLSYSSAATDGTGGTKPDSQAGSVGKGWTLDAGGYVALNQNTGSSEHQWDTFSVVFHGESSLLVRGDRPLNGDWGAFVDPANWEWHPVDETFSRFQKSPSSDSWIAWSKDGTRYEFATPLRWGSKSTTPTYSTYKWLLSKVVDPHGNAIVYTYHVDTLPNHPSVNATSYLESISWGFDGATPGTGTARYKVTLTTPSRWEGTTANVDKNWATSPDRLGDLNDGSDGNPHEAYKVTGITLAVMLPGSTSYTTVQQYTLGYAASADSMTTDASHGPSVLTLTSIQRADGAGNALPATTFTYGMSQTANGGTAVEATPGWNRLQTVNNGQGGQITFTYEHVWHATDPAVSVSYSDYSNYYRLQSVKQEDISGKDYSRATLTTYGYGTPALNDEAHSAAVAYAHKPASGNGESRPFLATPEKSEFRGHTWATATTYDGATTSAAVLRTEQSWFYQGGGGTDGATCAVELTGDVVNTDGTCFKAMVDAEAFKGRAYRHEVRDGASVVSRDTHTFTRVPLAYYDVDPTKPNGSSASNNFRRVGLWRAFVYESQTVTAEGALRVTNPNDQLFAFKTVNSAYYTETGTLKNQTTMDGTGTTIRKEEHWYASHVDAQTYIIDREWQSTVRDATGLLLSLTHTFYDGATSPGTASGSTFSGPGDVTRVARYRDVPKLSDLTGKVLHSEDTTFTYDAYGNQTGVTSYDGLGTMNVVSNQNVVYSAAGSGAAAHASTTEYDPVFHTYPVKATNAKGHIQSATYNYGLGTLATVTDVNGNTSSAGYDGFGRMTSLVKPGDTAASPTLRAYYYDTKLPFQYLIATKASRDVTGDVQYESSLFYDGLGNQVQTKQESVGGAQQNLIVDMRYDGLGRLTKQSQMRHEDESWDIFNEYRPVTSFYRPTTTSYDALGRPLIITAPDGSKTEHHYNIDGTYTYDDVIDANRHRVQQRSDTLGRLREVSEIDGNCANGYWSSYACGGTFTATWAVSATTTYRYDELDRLTATKDALGNTSSMSYDSQSHKVGQIDPDMGTWAYTYDAHGNLQTQKDAKNVTTTYGYDELNRLTNIAFSDGTLGYSYAYDQAGYSNGIGQRTTFCGYNSGSGCVLWKSWRYDSRGRVSQETQSYKSLAFTLNTTYDDAGRVATLGYDLPDTSADETLTYTYDAASRPYSLCTSLGAPCYITAASYDDLGHATKLWYGNGTYTEYAYTDPLARLNRVGVIAKDGTNLFVRSYGYDGVGNITTINAWDGAPANTTRQIQQNTYDARDRLAHAWTTGDSAGAYDQSYTYDLIGNLTEKGTVAQRYGSTWLGTGIGPHQMYATYVGGMWQNNNYDANGNLASSYKGTSTDGTGKRYTWDAANRLTKVENRTTAAGTTTYATQESYAYDADGSRVGRTTADGQTTVYFQGIIDSTIGGQTRKLYTFGGQTIAQRDSTSVTYLHNDYLGSVSVTTNEQGLKASKQEFDPWGNVRAGDVPETTLDYTGQRRDTTGLLYYNARYYDPVSGRFISADTVVPGNASGGMDGVALKPLTVSFAEPGFLSKLNQENQLAPWFQLSNKQKQQLGRPWGPANPQSLNRYSYVWNAPLRYRDPTGHLGITCELDCLGSITYHLTHEEADALYNVTTSLVSTIAEKGLSHLDDIKKIIIAVATAAGLAASLTNFLVSAVSALGPAATALAVLTTLGLELRAADWLYGDKGVDIRYQTIPNYVALLPPTVERQHQVWMNGRKVCSNFRGSPTLGFADSKPIISCEY